MSTGKNIKLHDPGEAISDHIYSCKFYFEMESLLFIAKTFRPNRVIDIGANLGNHSMFFSRELGIDTYAFEPCKRNFELLKENAPSAVSFNVALSDEVGTQFLLRLNPAWVIIRSEIFGMKSRSGGKV